MVEFNFLPPKKVVSVEVSSNQKRAFFYGIVIILSSSFLAIGIFIFKQNQDTQLSSLSSKKDQLTKQVESNFTKIGKISEFKNKVKGIKFIINSQFDYPSALTEFFKFIPSGVDVSSISIDKRGVFLAEVSASSSKVLSELVSNLTADGLEIKGVLMGEITRGEKGTYKTSISYTVPKDKKI